MENITKLLLTSIQEKKVKKHINRLYALVVVLAIAVFIFGLALHQHISVLKP
jgi:hypothetical protein